jgi:hypothetical protein
MISEIRQAAKAIDSSRAALLHRLTTLRDIAFSKARLVSGLLRRLPRRLAERFWMDPAIMSGQDLVEVDR